MKIKMSDVLNSMQALYVTTRRGSWSWPRVYSWDEFLTSEQIGSPDSQIFYGQLFVESVAAIAAYKGYTVTAAFDYKEAKRLVK